MPIPQPGTLDFQGKATGTGLQDSGAKTAKKVFPDGVYHFLIEGWKDALDASASDAELVAFLEGKGAASVHREFVGAIKSGGKATMGNRFTGYYTSSKITRMLNDEYTAKYAAKGIIVALSKLTVNPDKLEDRRFLWVELIDAGTAGDYVPAQKVDGKKDTDGGTKEIFAEFIEGALDLAM